MIREELSQLPSGTRDLRKFGVTVGSVFLLLGAWCLFRHRAAGPYLAAVGGVLFVLGLAAPRALRRVHFAWMLLALLLGLVTSGLLLSLLYLLVITPISLLARLLGKDFLSVRMDPHTPSYWQKRDPTAARKPEDYEQQF